MTRETKKKLALARRSKMLSQLGFSQSAKEPRMLVATAQLQGLDELEVFFALLSCPLFILTSTPLIIVLPLPTCLALTRAWHTH